MLIIVVVSPKHTKSDVNDAWGKHHTVMDFSIVSLQLSLNKINLTKKVPHVSNKKVGLSLVSVELT